MLKLIYLTLIIYTFSIGTSFARTELYSNSNLVDHPATESQGTRTIAYWKTNVGQWGESVVEQTLKIRGFNVLEIKSNGNQGIDRIAVKYNRSGELIDVRIIEVKTHRTNSIKLAETKYGKQMSRDWLVKKLKDMKSSSDPQVKKIYKDIRKYCRSKNIPLENLAEIHHLNTETGIYKIINPITGKESSYKISRILKQIALKTNNPYVKKWAENTLNQFEQIKDTNMTRYLNGVNKRIKNLAAKSLMKIMPKTTRIASIKILSKASRIIGPVVPFVIDSYEIYQQVQSYSRGELNKRETMILVSKYSGGFTGSIAGTWAGTHTGAWLGGPYAWITGPVGGIVGGIVGYFSISSSTEYLVIMWYSSLDDELKSKIDDWILNNSYQELIE